VDAGGGCSGGFGAGVCKLGVLRVDNDNDNGIEQELPE